MCKFFSLVSDGYGHCLYFDKDIRQKIINKSCFDKRGYHIYETDSHSSIMAYYGIWGFNEDNYNKYEYNPLTQELEIDRMNTKDDFKYVEQFCKELDFKTIVPELVIKPVINPFQLPYVTKIAEEDVGLLKEYAISVKELRFIYCKIESIICDSIQDSVGMRVLDFIKSQVWKSTIWIDEKYSVADSSVNLVYAYIGSFFTLPKWKYAEYQKTQYPFQSAVILWEKGLFPLSDGLSYRLYNGNGKLLWEGTLD